MPVLAGEEDDQARWQIEDRRVRNRKPAETKKYVYLGGSVIRELDGNNNVLKEYVRGLDMGGGIGSIIYQKKSSDYFYYHYNHKGDVVALTDANGKLAAFYEYDAWGNVMTEAEKAGVDPAEGGTTRRRNGTRSPGCTTSAPDTTPPKSAAGTKGIRRGLWTG